MPGPVSDSYDPEFGTGANASDVREGLEGVRDLVRETIGPNLENIVAVAQGPEGDLHCIFLSERDLRFIRFAINRAVESV